MLGQLAPDPFTFMDLKTRILVVDDDPGIREAIGGFLEQHGFAVEAARDGAEMRTLMAQHRFDVIVLDLMMPGEDGLTILRSLGAEVPPVIMLSVMGTDVDRIVGLELGADDYLAKPCNPRELLARIRAVLRRRGETVSEPEGGLRFAGWHLDPEARSLTDPDGAPAILTSGEFRLLLALAERPNRLLSRDVLLDLSRGENAEPFDRAIDVQISRLRRKLARPGAGDLIRTVRNEGYIFAAPVTRS